MALIRKNGWLGNKLRPMSTVQTTTPAAPTTTPTAPGSTQGGAPGRRQATAGTGARLNQASVRVTQQGGSGSSGSSSNPITMPKIPISSGSTTTPITMPKIPISSGSKPGPIDQVNPGRPVDRDGGTPSITGTTAGGMGRMSVYDNVNPRPRRSLK